MCDVECSKRSVNSSPVQLAFLAGVRWLDESRADSPTCNDLSDLVSDQVSSADSLQLVRECVAVAEAVAWVQQGRRLRTSAAQEGGAA